MNKKAFTLIELLVVVLIIGILSAIALPQYKWAVEKAHATEALVNLKTLHDAVEVYYMANGSYPTSWDQLDVEKPITKYFSLHLGSNGLVFAHSALYLIAYRSDRESRASNVYRLVCGPGSGQDNDQAKEFCKHLGADITKNDGTEESGRWPLIE